MSGWNNADSWAANERGPSNTWDAGAAEGVDWNAGAAAANDDAFNDNRYEATGGDEAMVNGDGGGHITSECTNNKVFDFVNVTTLPADDAWANVLSTAREAVETRDLDDFREKATAPVIVRQPAWTASLAATASEYPFPPNLSLLPNSKRLKGNPVTMPPSVPSPVQLKVLSANAARKVRKTSLRRAIRLLKLIVGHFAKDCPNNPGGSRACRNCG
ncbi:MAG: hypothetical protein LQ344_005408 [Seirophora lacunosa]|nr:MAG: hypothetical protein LQ344_005408 [Seirophora lacunosa]